MLSRIWPIRMIYRTGARVHKKTPIQFLDVDTSSAEANFEISMDEVNVMLLLDARTATELALTILEKTPFRIFEEEKLKDRLQKINTIAQRT